MLKVSEDPFIDVFKLLVSRKDAEDPAVLRLVVNEKILGRYLA